MRNIQELFNRYKDDDVLTKVGFGSKGYLINSDEMVSINRTTNEFITNEFGQVQTYEFISDEEWQLRRQDPNFNSSLIGTEYSWGDTLDKYYRHPYYPNKKIVRVEIVKTIPYAKRGTILYVYNNLIHIYEELILCSVNSIMEYPEFYKPLYD